MDVTTHHFSSLQQAQEAIPGWQVAGAGLPAGEFLIQVFAAIDAVSAQRLARTLRQQFPKGQLIGMSINNAVIDAYCYQGEIVISLVRFDHTRLAAGYRSIGDEPAAEAAVLFQQLHADDNQALICFVHGIDAAQQDIFSCLGVYTRYAPIVGGITDHSVEAAGPWVMLGELCAPGIIAAIALRSDRLSVWQDAFLEWAPVGRRMSVTRAEGQRLYALDDDTVLASYARYFSGGNECAFEVCQDFPLVCRVQHHQFYSAPVKLFPDGSMEMTDAVPQGAEVQFSYFHPSLSRQRIAEGLQGLAAHSPELFFLYNCASRIFNDDDRIEEELEVFSQIAPSVGAYCFGEFTGAPFQQITHHSITYLALSEGESYLNELSKTPFPARPRGKPLSPVFNLINNAFADLEQMNQQLEHEVEQKTQALLASYRQHRLTGLPNRELLLETLSERAYLSAICVIKLGNLGPINHRFGDPVGNRAIVWLTEQIKGQVQGLWPRGGELFQLSASEWLLAICEPASVSVLESQLLASIEAIEESDMSLNGSQGSDYLNVTLMAGFYYHDSGQVPASSVALDRLVHRANEARRVARRRNLLLWRYREKVSQPLDLSNEMDWLYRVRKALKQQRLVIFGQPIYQSGSRALASIECLVRIVEDGKFLPPGAFLPVILQTNQYNRITREVISQSIALLDGAGINYSINLAPQDLHNQATRQHLVASLKYARYPEFAGVEILETEQIADYNRFAQLLKELRELGVKIIIDDFGAGYSNLDEVLRLQPDVVKLDGSLAWEMDTNPRQRLMVEHLNNLCQSLKIKTTAEFVRNQAICERAESIGVDYLQGFYLAEPCPVSDLIEWE